MSRARACYDGGEWKKRQIAEQSSTAMPRRLCLHARTAHSTSRFAAFPLSGVPATICTASSFDSTSHTFFSKKVHVRRRQTSGTHHRVLLKWKGIEFKIRTPSVARMTNWSLLLILLCVTSGAEMTP